MFLNNHKQMGYSLKQEMVCSQKGGVEKIPEELICLLLYNGRRKKKTKIKIKIHLFEWRITVLVSNTNDILSE